MQGVRIVYLLTLTCVGIVSQRTLDKPKTITRPIQADQLRDFPGVCFASTKCGTVEPGQTWDLKPFCGQSTCVVANDGKLIEVVEECQPAPNEGSNCLLNDAKTNITAPFPDCCPVYDCEDDVQLEDTQETTIPPSSTRKRTSRRRG